LTTFTGWIPGRTFTLGEDDFGGRAGEIAPFGDEDLLGSTGFGDAFCLGR